MEDEKCECGMPLSKETSCDCDPKKCCFCCECEDDCSCGCEDKANKQKD